MGNHENEMIHSGFRIVNALLHDEEVYGSNDWFSYGGKETLLSYGILAKDENGSLAFTKEIKAIEQFQDDIEWMKTLPLHLEVDTVHSSGKKVVVSHSNISMVWHLRDDVKKVEKFKDIALWTRDFETLDEVEIFNIYGHSPVQNGAKEEAKYINIDIGCCYAEEMGYGVLTAYCVESGEIVSVLNS